jgi:alkanesulfonate monooxygenase SsuD/methylene tetrahydromethanopterin reductase-like flavin-dependent oxidoreductase (luciferase family)
MALMQFSVGGSGGLSWPAHVEVARAVEDLGFHGFYPSDHLTNIYDRGEQDRLDAPSTLLALSGRTSRIRLGTMIQANLLRHPVNTAMIYCTLDLASNGRADLCLGAGGARREYDINGYYYPDTVDERIARLDEAVQIIIALWTNDGPITFEGNYYQLSEAPFFPKPVQKPRPPIMIGGMHSGTMRVAAKYADNWNSLGALKVVDARKERMREICSDVGRDFATLGISKQGGFLLTEDKAEAQAFIDRYIARITRNPAYTVPPQYSSVEEHARGAGFVGGASELIEIIGRWLEIGITHLNLQTPRPFKREMLEQFATKVMPAFN